MKRYLTRIESYAQENLKGEKVTGMDHARRVWRGCQILSEDKQVDMDVLYAAAFLHDISCPLKGRKEHFEDSAVMAAEFLNDVGFPEEKIEDVLHCIRAHSRFGGPDPQTREAKIIYDADVLDFIGAIGIVRGVTRGFEWGFSGDVSEAPSIFTRMKDMVGFRELYTEKGRKLAENRYVTLDKFIAKLNEELEYNQ